MQLGGFALFGGRNSGCRGSRGHERRQGGRGTGRFEVRVRALAGRREDLFVPLLLGGGEWRVASLRCSEHGGAAEAIVEGRQDGLVQLLLGTDVCVENGLTIVDNCVDFHISLVIHLSEELALVFIRRSLNEAY